MTEPTLTHEELEALVGEYQHLLSEHRRAGVESTVRRHQHARLLELQGHFERLLREWVSAEEACERWRERLHHGAPAPAQPQEARAPLAFKGRSAGGAVVEVLERADGDYDVLVDGAAAERLAGGPHVFWDTRGGFFRLDGLEFREVFDATASAVAGLREFVAHPDGEPPWPYARELAADGLIDRNFALTPRGRRALS